MTTPIALTATVQLLPLLAAQAEAGQPAPSLLMNLLVSLLPFAMIGLILYWFLRKTQSGPRAKRTDDYMTRHQQHMEKVEQSLERIARALEQKP